MMSLCTRAGLEMAEPRNEVQATFMWHGATISVVVGDLTRQDTDAIVCPANSYGHMRGGVAKSIYLAGGSEIEKAARARAPVRIGTAISTTSGALKAKRVYHAPTMREPVETARIRNIESAMRAVLRLARKERISSLSVPGMGTGTGGLAYSEGARVVAEAICCGLRAEGTTLLRIELVALSPQLSDQFIGAIGHLVD